MKSIRFIAILMILSSVCVSCAYLPPDRYNTQKGALIGAGTGALIGQAVGHNTTGTLIGLAAGTILGGLVGNAVDQDYAAARDAASSDKPVAYYDRKGLVVETVPGAVSEKTNCRKVTKRTWQDGKLISETVEEVCSDPEVTVIERPTYVYPVYPRVYYYYGPRPYYHRHHPYGHYW